MEREQYDIAEAQRKAYEEIGVKIVAGLRDGLKNTNAIDMSSISKKFKYCEERCKMSNNKRKMLGLPKISRRLYK